MEKKDKLEKVFNYAIGCLGLLGVLATIITMFLTLRSPSVAIHIIEQISNMATTTPVFIEITSVVRATNTIPTVAPTSVNILFQDDFDRGLRPEWRILNGTPVIQDGRLGSATGELTLIIGDDNMSDYIVEFDYYGSYEGADVEYLQFGIGPTLQYVFPCYGHRGRWKAFIDGQWSDIAETDYIESPARILLKVSDDNYQLFYNQTIFSKIIFPVPITGPFSITFLDDGRFIDNFILSSP